MQVITTHINADFDALASMIAAQKLYPKAKVVFPGSQEGNLRYLLTIPEYKIQHYKIKEIDFNQVDHLILVDTRMADRIGALAKILSVPDLIIHIFDHHPSHPNDIHGQFELVKPVGATATLFVQVFQEKGIQITHQEATIMALGIYEDTGCLSFSSTTAEDLHAAGYLLTQGANLNMIADLIDRGLTTKHIDLMNELLKSLEIHIINNVSIHIATASIDQYVGDIAILAHKIRDIENLDTLFILIRMEDRVHLVARSRIREVDAGQIAREFKGGGHHTAASVRTSGDAGRTARAIRSLCHTAPRPDRGPPVRHRPVPTRVARSHAEHSRANPSVWPQSWPRRRGPAERSLGPTAR